MDNGVLFGCRVIPLRSQGVTGLSPAVRSRTVSIRFVEAPMRKRLSVLSPISQIISSPQHNTHCCSLRKRENFRSVRFNELQRYLGKISDKTLSQNLKELEKDELIHREAYPQIPPKVEYSLTERGKSLMVVLDQLCIWGTENRK